MLDKETLKKANSSKNRIAICKHCGCNIEPTKFGWKHVGFTTSHHRAELPITYMINVGKDGTIRAKLDIQIVAYLDEGDERSQIPLEEAKELISNQLDKLASSNDGSELLNRAEFILI